MDEPYGLGVRPVASHKTSSTSLFGSLKRKDSKHSYRGSASLKTKHYQVSRPPPGLVSYQIPHVSQPPSDNISYDPRRYSAGLSHIRSHSHSRSQSSYALAGVHPQHLHNGGRAYKSAVKGPAWASSDSPGRYQPAWPGPSSPRTQRYTGEPGKRYRKSPVPVIKAHHLAEEESPPPPPGDQTNGNPKPPPRLRPKSWTSSLFSAFKLSSNKASANNPPAPLSREISTVSTVTLNSLSTNTQEKKGLRSSFSKQVRFLANPAKPLEPNQKFYSLPHFARPSPALPLPEKVTSESVSVKARSRTPSPFGRLVKTLVKGSRGGNLPTGRIWVLSNY